MKMRSCAVVLFLLLPGTARASVSHELVVGLERDSSRKVTDSSGADLTDTIASKNVLYLAQYTHYFSPLAEDGRPIELRQFYRHPSTFSAGVAFLGIADKDRTVSGLESDTSRILSMLLLGGEYFFPTGTGLFLNIRSGSATVKNTIGGVAQPEVDLESGRIEFGVRHYVVPSLEFHVAVRSESETLTPPGGQESASDRGASFLGVRGIIKDAVGLSFEVGGGEREDTTGGSTARFDITALNLEGAVYVLSGLSFSLAIEAWFENGTGLPAGFEYAKTTSRSTLAVRYWFSERFGLDLPVYAVRVKERTVVPLLGETKLTRTNKGTGLYALFRF